MILGTIGTSPDCSTMIVSLMMLAVHRHHAVAKFLISAGVDLAAPSYTAAARSGNRGSPSAVAETIGLSVSTLGERGVSQN